VATYCAVELARRRGNPVPSQLVEDFNRYKDDLAAIQAGSQELTADSGLATPTFDNLPMVTNLRVDSRYQSKIRRVYQNSTQAPQSPLRRGFDSTAPIYYW
jgi:hypothetical protein